MAVQLLELLGSSQGGDPQPLLHLLAIQRFAALASTRRAAQLQVQAGGQDGAPDVEPRPSQPQQEAAAQGSHRGRPALPQLQVPSLSVDHQAAATAADAEAQMGSQVNPSSGTANGHPQVSRQASLVPAGLFHGQGLGLAGEAALPTPRTPRIPLQASPSMHADSLSWLDGLGIGGGPAAPRSAQHWTERCLKLGGWLCPVAKFNFFLPFSCTATLMGFLQCLPAGVYLSLCMQKMPALLGPWRCLLGGFWKLRSCACRANTSVTPGPLPLPPK